METITYFKMWTLRGKMFSESVTIGVSELNNEIWHMGFKTAKDLINYWDIVGKGMKKYRYFLVSPDINLQGKM